MTHLLKEFLSHWTHSTLTGFAMFLFLGVFVGMVIWAYGRGSTERFAVARGLPLDDLKPLSQPKENENE